MPITQEQTVLCDSCLVTTITVPNFPTGATDWQSVAIQFTTPSVWRQGIQGNICPVCLGSKTMSDIIAGLMPQNNS